MNEGREKGKARRGGKEGGTWILDSCSGGSWRPCWVEVGSRGGYRGVVIVWWKGGVLRVRLRLWVHSWSRAARLRYGSSTLGKLLRISTIGE